jgi:hypothetical protein
VSLEEVFVMTLALRSLAALATSTAVLSVGMIGAVAADPVCNAANECGTYKLATISQYWNSPPPDGTPVSIVDSAYDSQGGDIVFRIRSTDTSAACVGASQVFRFSWTFDRDVTTLSGKSGTTLALMTTEWEGEAGDQCVNEDPFVWIRSGGRYGSGEAQQVSGDTFKLTFVNQGGENRNYSSGNYSSINPTISMNGPLYATGGFEIMPNIKYFGNPMSIVYVYQRVPDGQTPTVKVRAVHNKGALLVDVDPNLGAGSYRFQIQVRKSDGSWATLSRVYRTQGANETRLVDLPRGVYRVMAQPKSGSGAGYSSAVRLVR